VTVYDVKILSLR